VRERRAVVGQPVEFFLDVFFWRGVRSRSTTSSVSARTRSSGSSMPRSCLLRGETSLDRLAESTGEKEKERKREKQLRGAERERRREGVSGVSRFRK